MAKNFIVVVANNDDEQPLDSTKESLHGLWNLLQGRLSGTGLGDMSITALNTAVAASGTLTLSGASGTVGVTINGVSVTVSTGASDSATATALAAAINASSNNLVKKHVTASAALGVVTITALIPGYGGNAVTIAASGTGATASGARLTGGSTDDAIAYTL